MTDRLDNLEKTFKKQLAIQVAKNQIFEQEIAVLKIKLSDDDDLNEEDGERNEVHSFFQHKSLQRGKREEKGGNGDVGKGVWGLVVKSSSSGTYGSRARTT